MTAADNRDGNRDPREQHYAVSPVNGARIPLGAHPHNTGGKPGRSGRRQDWMHEACARAVRQEGVPLLRRILRGKVAGATVADRMRAVELLAKYQSAVSILDVREALTATLDVLRTNLTPEVAEDIAAQMRPLWVRRVRGNV